MNKILFLLVIILNLQCENSDEYTSHAPIKGKGVFNLSKHEIKGRPHTAFAKDI